MRRGLWLAVATFVLVWVPATLWRGIAMGRSFRIGRHGQDSVAPLVDAVIQIGFIMLAPALLAALFAFALWAWREERRAARTITPKT
jgi:hypothetical protein